MPSLFAKRLFLTMANAEWIKVSSSQNEGESNEPEGASDRLEKIVERKKFEEVLAKIYFGNVDEQCDLIFNM